MIRRPLFLCTLAFLAGNPALAQQIPTPANPPQRTANEGNVVLSGIPEVPASEAEQIVRVVRANNRPVWYMNALNEGHGYRRKENQELMSQAVVLFLREHLLPMQSSAANAGDAVGGAP